MIDPAGLVHEAVVARPAADELTITRVFTVQPGVLWDLFTNPRHFSGWWGPRTGECVKCEMDLRVGGRWRTDIKGASGEIFVIHGEYFDIQPPHRLVYSWAFGEPGEPDRPVSEVTLDFGARGRGSELRLYHRKLSPEMAESHQEGWLGCFLSLDDYIQEKGL